MKPKSNKRTRWEYLKVTNLVLIDLNEFGAKGWELISVISCHQSDLPFTVFYFKRKRNE